MGSVNSDDGSVDIEEPQANGELKQEDGQRNAACQVCGEDGDLLKCDVSTFLLIKTTKQILLYLLCIA